MWIYPLNQFEALSATQRDLRNTECKRLLLLRLSVHPPTSSPLPLPHYPLWHGIAGINAALLIACLAGIVSRPLDFTASFWPANAVLLGLLLRHPRHAHFWMTWVAAWLTYVSADLLTGSSMFVALSLNTANIFGVALGWLFLRRHTSDVLSFQRQRSVLIIFAGCMISAASSAAFGAWPSKVAFNASFWDAAHMWVANEFYCTILILPLVLTAPRGWVWQWTTHNPQHHSSRLYVLPFITLILSEALSLMVPGPGSMGFSMPAMVWCAMSYGVFSTALLNLVLSLCKTAAIAFGAFTFTPDHAMEATSFRLGLALMSLAPLAVACAYALHEQALRKLHYAVNHDFLTGVLARSALMERGKKILSRLEEEGQPVAVLMMDIDHFKAVNDRYGHAQGDVVLKGVAQLALAGLRPDDLLGRTGGEEFAIVLPRTSREQALSVAQRICEQLREHVFAVPNHAPLRVTLSIGLHSVSSISAQDTMEQLLSKADEALYLAKNNGRNQVRQYGPALAPSAI